MRPRNLDEFVGQEHLLGPGRLLRRAIEQDTVRSCILWGPPGTGKTTLARIIAAESNAHFSPLSAVSAGVADLRRVVGEAQQRGSGFGVRSSKDSDPTPHSEPRTANPEPHWRNCC
jgi:putative ATPase